MEVLLCRYFGSQARSGTLAVQSRELGSNQAKASVRLGGALVGRKDNLSGLARALSTQRYGDNGANPL
jgi:hypothetical protein